MKTNRIIAAVIGSALALTILSACAGERTLASISAGEPFDSIEKAFDDKAYMMPFASADTLR